MFLQLCKRWNNWCNGEKLDAHINDEDYWMGKKIWNEFNMKNMSDYHDHYLKRDVFVIS